MSDVVAAAVLGIVQGLTEFLPISSTAHLLLAEKVLALDPARFGLTFTIALHMGTLLAVLLYFARVWLELLRDALGGRWSFIGLLAAGTVPAVVAGFLLQAVVERGLRDVRFVAAALVAGSLVFFVAERLASQRRSLAELTLRDALAMGAAQAIALIPGVSRSGITISAGLALGVRRADATRFSFLLATPVILGAGAKTLLDAQRAAALLERPDLLTVGFVTSFVSGLAAVAFLVRFLRDHSLNWFVAYRMLLAGAIILALAAGLL